MLDREWTALNTRIDEELQRDGTVGLSDPELIRDAPIDAVNVCRARYHAWDMLARDAARLSTEQVSFQALLTELKCRRKVEMWMFLGALTALAIPDCGTVNDRSCKQTRPGVHSLPEGALALHTPVGPACIRG